MWRTWWREARAASRRSDVRWRGILINSFGHHLPPSALSGLRHLFLQFPLEDSISFLRNDWREAVARAPKEEPIDQGDPYQLRLAAIRRNDLGVIRKSAYAQAGLTELDPTADRRLMEFSLTLPPEQLFHNGQSRPLARAALADRIPAKVLDLKVRGLQAADWYLHLQKLEANEALEEMEPHPEVRDLLDISRMKRAIENWPDDDWNSERHIATYRLKLTAALATGIFLTQFSTQPSL
jgi:asparagine synthase (glutamine-hydrolysing)